jgi:hypothetical protein
MFPVSPPWDGKQERCPHEGNAIGNNEETSAEFRKNWPLVGNLRETSPTEHGNLLSTRRAEKFPATFNEPLNQHPA